MRDPIVERALAALKALNEQPAKAIGKPRPSEEARQPVENSEEAWPETDPLAGIGAPVTVGNPWAGKPCFHCGGSGECDCISCGRYAARMEWAAGPCVPCGYWAREKAKIQ